MNAIAPAPLLLDNEVLRACLRQREAEGLPPAAGLCVSHVVKAAALPALQQAVANWPDDAEPPVSAWPEAIRQLHWELCSSTTLRPVAHLMGKGALLPDPWNLRAGLHRADRVLPDVLRQHPRTRLFTILRLDVVLAGTEQVVSDVGVWQAQAGDVLLLSADLPVQVQLSPDARVWTVYDYAPDPCCCRSTATALDRKVKP